MAQASSPVTVQRREKNGTRRNVECLPLLPDYQSFMRGIDRGDQLMDYYNVGRRSKEWWKHVVLNAYIFLKSSNTGGKKQDYLIYVWV